MFAHSRYLSQTSDYEKSKSRSMVDTDTYG